MTQLSPSDEVAHPPDFQSRPVRASDWPAIEALHDVAFGPGALTRAAYRAREEQPRISPFCRTVYRAETIVAAIRYTPIRIGGTSGPLLLGPLAVAPAFANQGHGRRLLAESLEVARATGIELVLLVGDPPYYARFGFVRAPAGRFIMPGPVDPSRILFLEMNGGIDLKGRFTGRVTGAAS